MIANKFSVKFHTVFFVKKKIEIDEKIIIF